MAHIHNKCDFCSEPAIYDGKTAMGPWAFMCERHFETYGLKVEGLYNRLAPVVEVSKVCVICHQTKPVTEFYKYKDAHGVERYRNECKTCNLEQRKRLRFKKK